MKKSECASWGNGGTVGGGRENTILSTLIFQPLLGAPQPNGNWSEDMSGSWTLHRGKHRGLTQKLTWWVVKVCWGYLSCCGTNLVGCPLLKSSVSVEGPVYGLQNWFPRLMAWWRQTDWCRCCVCLYMSLFSMPALSCQLNWGREVYLKIRPGIKWNIVCKGAQENTLSQLCLVLLEFPVLATLEIFMWILHYFSSIKTKKLWKATFCQKFRELDLFQFGVNPYVKLLEFPAGNTIFQPTLLQRLRQG